MPISLDKAEVIALVLESCLFGVFTSLFCATLWILSNKSATGYTSRPLVITVCSMYILAATHLSINVYRAIAAFINHADVPHGALAYFGDISNSTEVAKNVVYSIQTILADSFFVWRCYVIWSKRWSIIVFPVLMLPGTMVGCCGVCWLFSRAKPGNAVFESDLAPWITYAFSMTLATNIICAGLVVFRLKRSQRLAKLARADSLLLPVMFTIIESGVLYSSAMISVIATYATGNNAQYIILEMLTPLIGIVFTLIIVQVGLGISSNGNATTQSRRSIGIPNLSTTLGSQHTSVDYSMKPLTIPVSVEVVKHTDIECAY